MKLGFSVADLLPHARGGGQLRMGLSALSESEWLQPQPDLTAREAAFAEFPDGYQTTPYAKEPGEELAEMLGVTGGLLGAARTHHEDMCLLKKFVDEDFYRLIGAAVAWPSDWQPKDKMGLPLAALHAPIQGYAEQLASGVDHFMTKLKPGRIFGRCNWFIAPTSEGRWIAENPEQDFAGVNADNAGDRLFVRSERQTLRRLPETGAILFTIGVYVEPLGSLPDTQIDMLTRAVSTLLDGEGERRAAHHFANSLIRYNQARKRNELC